MDALQRYITMADEVAILFNNLGSPTYMHHIAPKYSPKGDWVWIGENRSILDRYNDNFIKSIQADTEDGLAYGVIEELRQELKSIHNKDEQRAHFKDVQSILNEHIVRIDVENLESLYPIGKRMEHVRLHSIARCMNFDADTIEDGLKQLAREFRLERNKESSLHQLLLPNSKFMEFCKQEKVCGKDFDDSKKMRLLYDILGGVPEGETKDSVFEMVKNTGQFKIEASTFNRAFERSNNIEKRIIKLREEIKKIYDNQ